jgi:hypothetical protein
MGLGYCLPELHLADLFEKVA